MAYLHEDKQTVELDLPLDKVWTVVEKVLTSFKWSITQIDDTSHHIEAKTEAHFLSYASILLIDAVTIDENKTRVTVVASTPGTTITTMFDFGRTGRERINLFLRELLAQSK
jgi:hypothetical protein